MFCPNCQTKLTKKPDTGEGVKVCPECSASWFILECRRGKDVVPVINRLKAAIGFPWFDELLKKRL